MCASHQDADGQMSVPNQYNMCFDHWKQASTLKKVAWRSAIVEVSLVIDHDFDLRIYESNVIPFMACLPSLPSPSEAP